MKAIYLREHLLSWLDDTLLHTVSMSQLLKSFKNRFHYFVSYNLKLHPLKSVLTSNSIGWCGLIVYKDVICFDPERFLGLQNMQAPITRSHLQQFVCAINWVRTRLPDFSSTILLPQGFLKQICRHIRNAPNRISRFPVVNAVCSQKEEKAFVAYKGALMCQVALSRTSVKLEIDAAARSPKFLNSDLAISYCAVCNVFVVIPAEFPILRKS